MYPTTLHWRPDAVNPTVGSDKLNFKISLFFVYNTDPAPNVIKQS